MRLANPNRNPNPNPNPNPNTNPNQVRPGAAAAAGVTAALTASVEARVGGLERQLDSIVRRVLASRADPAAARRLGVSHVRG